MAVIHLPESFIIGDSGTVSNGCVAPIATAPTNLKLHLHCHKLRTPASVIIALLTPFVYPPPDATMPLKVEASSIVASENRQVKLRYSAKPPVCESISKSLGIDKRVPKLFLTITSKLAESTVSSM